ncbi:MAG: mannose-6-phosphate isomerase [Clostridia bacterium]|nr:mannose-6-phosphate isomerase [Clostridia bacterium]
MRNYALKPVFFKPNRVRRIYTGGALMDTFLDRPEKLGDGFLPEEWIASTVIALNENPTPSEGLSFIETETDTELSFRDLLAAYPTEMLGSRSSFDVLVKYLDSAIRLPVQAHPTKAFSRANFGSDYGKTESWLVLATRENAEIYFGFNRALTKEEFSAAVEKSRADKNALVPFLGKTDVKPGDLFLIPAGLAHAIGYGCLILEVQEPTDFTIQPEYYCGDYALSEREMYIGLPKEVALDCFDYTLLGEKAVAAARKTPHLVRKTENYAEYALISYEDTPCFAFSRYDVTGTLALTPSPALYVVIEGEGEVYGKDYRRPVRRGDYFFMPYAAEGFSLTGNVSVIAVFPSKQ